MNQKIAFILAIGLLLAISVFAASVTTKAGDLYVDGKIGVGTTTPQEALHVQNGGIFGQSFVKTNGFFSLGTGANGWDWMFTPQGTTFRSPTGLDVLSFSNNGNVGIGTSNPNGKLHITGGSGWTTVTWQKDIRLDGIGAIEFGGGLPTKFGMGASGDNLYFFSNTAEDASVAPNYRMYITKNAGVNFTSLASGPVYSNSGTLTNTNPSSLAYKKNVQPVNLNAQRLLGLSPKSFVWKDTGKSDVGYIAEEVKQILPELYRDDGTTKGYAADKLPIYTIELLKQQQKQIDALTKIVCADHPQSEYCKQP